MSEKISLDSSATATKKKKKEKSVTEITLFFNALCLEIE